MAKKKRLLKWYLDMEGNVYAHGIYNVKKNSQQWTLTYMLVNVLYQLKYFNVPTGEKDIHSHSCLYISLWKVI